MFVGKGYASHPEIPIGSSVSRNQAPRITRRFPSSEGHFRKPLCLHFLFDCGYLWLLLSHIVHWHETGISLLGPCTKPRAWEVSKWFWGDNQWASRPSHARRLSTSGAGGVSGRDAVCWKPDPGSSAGGPHWYVFPHAKPMGTDRPGLEAWFTPGGYGLRGPYVQTTPEVGWDPLWRSRASTSHHSHANSSIYPDMGWWCHFGVGKPFCWSAPSFVAENFAGSIRSFHVPRADPEYVCGKDECSSYLSGCWCSCSSKRMAAAS